MGRDTGFDQGEKVQNLIDEKFWRLVDIRPDLQSIPRIVVVQRSHKEAQEDTKNE